MSRGRGMIGFAEGHAQGDGRNAAAQRHLRGTDHAGEQRQLAQTPAVVGAGQHQVEWPLAAEQVQAVQHRHRR